MSENGITLGSRSVVVHILKGVLGFGLLAIALLYAPDLGWWAAVPLVGALVCFQGCPMCWTVGLIATVLRRETRAACAIRTDTSLASR
jgi:hypothetical protein